MPSARRDARPLTTEQFAQLCAMEAQIAADKADGADTATKARHLAALKRSGLWGRPTRLPEIGEGQIPYRPGYSWAEYCRIWLPHTRRYIDLLIARFESRPISGIAVNRTRAAQIRDLAIAPGKDGLTPVIGVKLKIEHRRTFMAMAIDAGKSNSDMLRAMIEEYATNHGYIWLT